MFFLVALGLAVPFCRAGAGQDELAGRIKWFKASVPAASRHAAPPASAAELEKAALTAVKVYKEFLPEGYRKAIGYYSKPTWNTMLAWYKATSQEVMLMGREAARLSGACAGLEGQAAAAGAAKSALGAAEDFLKFIDETSWPEALRAPMTGEVRASQVKAIKRWRELAACR